MIIRTILIRREFILRKVDFDPVEVGILSDIGGIVAKKL